MITICTKNMSPLFSNREFTVSCISILSDLCERFNFELYCYCFMPDHVHFIISVKGSYSIVDLVAMFKSLASKKGRDFGLQAPIFQSRFYDHFLRVDEELIEKINYIIENPVRKSLVKDLREYPFSFSSIIDQ